MSDAGQAELIQQLAAAVAQLAKPLIPIDVALWDMATIGEFLHRNPQVVRERIACLPGFPKAVRLPTATTAKRTGQTQPMYWAREIIDWAKSYQEKH